jgi:hypothetical protein
METKYHEIIAVTAIRQIPKLAAFYEAQGYGEEKIRADSIRPDMVYKDSIYQGAELHHAHSYKEHIVNGKVCWLDGDCLERVKAIAADCRNYRANNDYQLMCRFLGEWTHYAVDCHTYPHLVKGQPWTAHHLPWEVNQGTWIKNNQDRIGKLNFVIYKDIYKAFCKDAREMYPEALKLVKLLEKGDQLSDHKNLMLAQRIATAVGSGLLTITKKFWPTE